MRRPKYPRISVITPSYNQGKYIERTVQSVLQQNYPNLEFIVMDGGSNDQTVKILKKYNQKIIWKSQPDNGQTHAINKGLQIATGDILAYLNSDDTYEPHTLHRVAQYFQKHPEAEFVYGQGKLIDSNDKDIGMYNTLPMDFRSLHRHSGISQPAAFWRRSLFNKTGLFDESFHYTMDYEYWVRAAKVTQLHQISDILANTRIHADAKTSAFTVKLYRDAIRVNKLHYGKVHPDWIFTYTDGLVHHYKDGKWYQEVYYWLFLFLFSYGASLFWNHNLLRSGQYQLWLKEALHRFRKRLKAHI